MSQETKRRNFGQLIIFYLFILFQIWYVKYIFLESINKSPNPYIWYAGILTLIYLIADYVTGLFIWSKRDLGRMFFRAIAVGVICYIACMVHLNYRL